MTPRAEAGMADDELRLVREALVPLFPAADDGTVVELAQLAAEVIAGHRDAVDRQTAWAEASAEPEGLEPVRDLPPDLPPDLAVAPPGWRRRALVWLGWIPAAIVGVILAGLLGGAIAAGVLL